MIAPICRQRSSRPTRKMGDEEGGKVEVADTITLRVRESTGDEMFFKVNFFRADRLTTDVLNHFMAGKERDKDE